ncbi:uncharacterized protein STEHIDRAFT_68803, partial [Stereum hirsutum FP-91666 SS1]
GFHACLFFGAAYFISKTGAKPRVRILQNLFIFILFVLGTIYIGCDSTFLEMMFIEDRDFPGGPAMFLEARYGASTVSTATNLLILTPSTSLQVYRLWVIWSKDLCVVVLPFFLLLSVIALGVTACIKTSRPNYNIWSSSATPWNVAFWSISIFLNIVVTFGIVLRLLYIRRLMKKTLPTHDVDTRMYTSISAMVVESAVIHTVTYTAYLVCYAVDAPFQRVLLPVLSQAMCIAPELIALRVALGQAWSHKTGTYAASRIAFQGGHHGTEVPGLVAVPSSVSPRQDLLDISPKAEPETVMLDEGYEEIWFPGGRSTAVKVVKGMVE